MLNKKNLLGIDVTDATLEEVLEYTLKILRKKPCLPAGKEKKCYFVTPNPEIIVFANKHQDFKNILNNAEIALADGVGVVIGSRLLEKELKSRITGVDFMERLCEKVSKKPITVGFLGGGPKIAEKTADCLKRKYPGLKVVFTGREWSGTSNIDLLFVAFGFPKQERWISENLEKLPVTLAIGVGGAFDYISGKIPRAPLFLRNAGLEWLYRLIRQPWRIKRQLALTEFGLLVLKERIKLLKWKSF